MQRTPPRAFRSQRAEHLYPSVGHYDPHNPTLLTQEESPESPLKFAANANAPTSGVWASEYKLQFTWKTPPRVPVTGSAGIPTTHSDGVQVPEPVEPTPVASHYSSFDPPTADSAYALSAPPPVLTYPNPTKASGGPAAFSTGPPRGTSYLRPIPTPAGYIPSGFSHPECRAAGLPSRGDYGLVGARMDPHYMPAGRAWVPSNPYDPASERWQNGVWGRGNIYNPSAPTDQPIEPQAMGNIAPATWPAAGIGSRSLQRHVSFADHTHPPLPAVTTNDDAERALGTDPTPPLSTAQKPTSNYSARTVDYTSRAPPAAPNAQYNTAAPNGQAGAPDPNFDYHNNYTSGIPPLINPAWAPSYSYTPPVSNATASSTIAPANVDYRSGAPASVPPGGSTWAPPTADYHYNPSASIQPATSTWASSKIDSRSNLSASIPPATSAWAPSNVEYRNNLPATAPPVGSAWAPTTSTTADPPLSIHGSPIHRYPMPAPPGGPPNARNAQLPQPDSTATLKNYLVARARDSRMYQSEYRRAFCDWPAAAATAKEDAEAARRAAGNWALGRGA
ncbi:hypothetical protein BDZ88DRAFT_404789 [Geranomyces variabilis]|nr:hypothetical protein BDZ88DRAFT_404789 [Geranomyces variabilis]KAJ3143397.1 hypothetical protein HDU90_000157 [Geranomyces variabilis]